MSIANDKVKKYWADRSKQQGRRTVGFANAPLDKQDEYYRKRIEFMLPHMNTELFTLDYGCGIGRFSKLFNPDKYLGVDVTELLLHIAASDNPEYNYIILNNPYITASNLAPIEQFFSSTVLQHNTDETIRLIVSSLKGLPIKRFMLYETTAELKSGGHMNFKSFEDYGNLISEVFEISKSEQFKFMPEHINIEHSLMIFDIDADFLQT